MRAMADAPAGGAVPRPARAAAPSLPLDSFRRPRRSRSPAPIVLAALAAAAIVAGVVAWALAPRGAPPPPPEAGAAAESALDPIRPRADAQTGEQIAPFSGFAVSVDSEPSGALVSVDGVPRGEAPVIAGVDCSPGDRVELAAERAGFPVTRSWTTCRRDALVKLTIRLRR